MKAGSILGATSGAEQLASWSTLAQATLVAVALAVAAVQLRDARTDRRSRERPFVVVELDGERHPEEVDIVVRNIGQTIARNVTIRFSPPLQTTLDDTGFGAPFMKAFTDLIPTLTPGQSMRCLFDTGPERLKSDLPTTYTVSIDYEGDLKGAKPYSEETMLDLDLFKNRVYVQRRTIHDVYGQLERINKSLAKIATDRPSR